MLFNKLSFFISFMLNKDFIKNEIRFYFWCFMSIINDIYNFRKLNSYNEELYPEDDNSPFWDDYKFIDYEGR